MAHLVCTAYTTDDTQPTSFGVTIDGGAEEISTIQTLGDNSVRLYYDLFEIENGTHTYSVVAILDDDILGESRSDPATGQFTLNHLRIKVRKQQSCRFN